MKKIIAGWNEFFFKPTSPATLGLFRIAFGFVVFLSNLGHFPSRDIFYGENGIVRYQTLDAVFPRVHPWIFMRWVPQTEPALKYYFIALIIVTVFFTLGIFSRISTILLFLGIASLSNRNPYNENAGDTLIRVNLFFLMFTNAGAAYSLDRYYRVKRGIESKVLKPISPWVQRLLQLQLSYVYIDTVYLKLPGESWRDGTAMYYALNYLELRRFDLKYFFYYLWQIKIATYMVLIGETSLGFLIWFRKLRYWMIAFAFILHEGINLSMQFPVFQYVMMASMINFIYPEDVERLLSRIKPPSQLFKRLSPT